MSLDSYIDNYYFTHLDALSKEKPPKYQYLTFQNLSPDQKLVQITISIKISDKLIIKDKIDWDLSDEKRNPERYASILIDSLSSLIIDQKLQEHNKKSIKNQIFEQLLTHLSSINTFPKFHVIRKPNDINGLNELCPYCGTVKYNDQFCVNCMNPFDKVQIQQTPLLKAPQSEQSNDEANLTDRQRILQLRQKNINIENHDMFDINGSSKEKKVCKKCGEINDKHCTVCKNCSYKFPIITCYNIYNNSGSYCVHFWDKLNKNHIIQQLKTFTSFFNKEDFSSLKFLYERTKEILSVNYKDILTDEAFIELTTFVERIYSLFAFPSATSQKAFDTAYFAKYNKQRPYINMLNYNDLENKEGWLPENDVNYKTSSVKIKQKVYDNIAKNTLIANDDIDEVFDLNGSSGDNLTKRKRGRPKKIEIFRDSSKNYGFGSEINEPQILLCDRVALMTNDIIIEDDLLHYDFCGRCFEEGKLICCETCSSAYHFECLGYDKFPRGKFKCYFCKVVKLGIADSHCVTQYHIDLVHKLIEINPECDLWFIKAEQLLDVLKEHQCASFFKDPVPKEVIGYAETVGEQRDLSLIEIKLTHWEYRTVNEFLNDLKLVWGNIKTFYKPKSFFWRQADIIEMFVNHLVKNEGIFERFDMEKEITEEDKEKYKEYKIKEKKKKEMKNSEKNKESNKKNKKKKTRKNEEEEEEDSKEDEKDSEDNN